MNSLRIQGRTILFFVIILMQSGHVMGQESKRIGIRAGLNLANNIALSDGKRVDDDHSYRAALHIGITSRFNLANKFSLNPEILYSKKGYKQESESVVIHYNYVNLPLLVGYNLGEKFTLQTGPEFGYLISAKMDSDGEQIDLIELYEAFDIDVKRLELGLTIASSYKLTDNLSIAVRYVHGISSVLKSGLPNTAGFYPNRKLSNLNRTFQFSLAYLIW